MWTAPSLQGVLQCFDQIACVHMSGLFARPDTAPRFCGLEIGRQAWHSKRRAHTESHSAPTPSERVPGRLAVQRALQPGNLEWSLIEREKLRFQTMLGNRPATAEEQEAHAAAIARIQEAHL